MPNNPTSFSRGFEEYSAILERLAINEKQKELFVAFNEKLRRLNETIGSLSGENSNVPLSGERLQTLKAQYRSAIEAAGQYIKEAGHTSGGAYVAGEVDRLLRKDAAVIDRIPPNSSVRLSDAFRRARSINIDIGQQRVSTVGGNFSNRMPISFTDASGRKRTGFFTPNVRIGDETGMLKMFSVRFPQYEYVWSVVRSDTSVIVRGLQKRDSKGGPILCSGEAGDPLRDVMSAEDYGRLTGDKNALRAFDDYVRMYVSHKNLSLTYVSNHWLHADEGSSVTDRNCAMSTMAGLLGIESVLAHSEKVSLVHNGRKVDGCFMDTAEGYDGDKVDTKDNSNLLWKWVKQTEDEPLSKPKLSANALREIANLEVLDYICGNVDRHTYNHMYKFKTDEKGNVLLDGLVGIDNDNAFGKDDMIHMGNQHNVGVKGLTILPRSTADKIMQLSGEKLRYMMADYGLSPKELAHAEHRLTAVQNRILNARRIGKDDPININGDESADRMYVVDDARFGEIDYAKLAYVGRSAHGEEPGMARNIFAKLGSGDLTENIYMTHTRKLKAEEKKAAEKAKKAVVYTEGTMAEQGEMLSEEILERFVDVHHTSGKLYKDAWWNTAEFKEMKQALDTLAASPKTASAADTMKLCATLREKTQHYIDLKKDAPDTDRGRERLSFARHLRNLCDDLTDEYNDSLLRTGELPKIEPAGPIKGEGDQLLEEGTVGERLARLEKDACDELSNALKLDDETQVLNSMAKILHYGNVRQFAEKNSDAAKKLLESPAVNDSIEKAKPLAKSMLENVGKERLSEMLIGPNAVENVVNAALQTINKQNSRSEEGKTAAPMKTTSKIKANEKSFI